MSANRRISIVIAGVVMLTASLFAAGWSVQTVDTGTGPGGFGFYHSFALDPQTGAPTIAYSDNDRDDVKFARLVGGVWQKQIVDAGKNVATGIDLAYDDAGRPGISYGWGALSLAEWNGTRWVIQTVVKSNAQNDDTSLVYHLNEPWIVYKATAGKSSKMMLAHRIGNVWTQTTIDTAGAGKFSALAFDSSGNPAVAYAADPDGDGTLSALRLARFSAGQWTIQQLETGQGAGVHVDLAFDPVSGEPAIVHRTSGGGTQVRYLYQQAGQWFAETVDTGVQTTLRFDSVGVATIAYSPGYNSGQVKLARRLAGTWTFEDVTTQAGYIESTGLEFGAGATAPTISFSLATVGTGGTRTLKLATPAP